MKKAVDCRLLGICSDTILFSRLKARTPSLSTARNPTASYQDFLKNENRYTRLAQSNPERAAKLFAEAETFAKAKYERLTKYSKLFD